jgi:putative PIN family toxin of toxin-antitoxin system
VKCVTDTNVIVSGLLWLGNPGRLLEAAANGRITLYTSPVLVAELRSTLSYGRLAQRVQRSGLTLDELLTRVLNVAIVVEPASVPQIVRDPDDDHVLACALVRSPLLPISSSPAIKICSRSTAIRTSRSSHSRGAAQDRGAEVVTPLSWSDNREFVHSANVFPVADWHCKRRHVAALVDVELQEKK